MPSGSTSLLPNPLNDRFMRLKTIAMMLTLGIAAGGKPKNKPLKAEKLAKFALSNELIKYFVLKMCHAYAMQDLLSGVTTVRAVGGLGDLDTRLRDKIEEGMDCLLYTSRCV